MGTTGGTMGLSFCVHSQSWDMASSVLREGGTETPPRSRNRGSFENGLSRKWSYVISSDWLPELSGVEGREIKYLRGPISTPRVPPRGTMVGTLLAWVGCYKVEEFSQRGCALLASCCRRWRLGQPLVIGTWLAVTSIACNLLARQGVVLLFSSQGCDFFF